MKQFFQNLGAIIIVSIALLITSYFSTFIFAYGCLLPVWALWAFSYFWIALASIAVGVLPLSAFYVAAKLVNKSLIGKIFICIVVLCAITIEIFGVISCIQGAASISKDGITKLYVLQIVGAVIYIVFAVGGTSLIFDDNNE